MGLSADAFYNVIKQVGNYSDIYNSNLNPVGLVREGSANANWKEGGPHLLTACTLSEQLGS
jgi:hypothetical protein